VEFGLEFEIANLGGDLFVGPYIEPGFGRWPGPFPRRHPPFPRYTLGPLEKYDNLTELFERDFWDAVGHEPSSLAQVDFERAFQELGLTPDAA
jgi:hypothetical protein